MNTEIALIAAQLKDVYDGNPWFGRPLKALLNDVEEQTVFTQPAGQHSLLQLLYHIINWRAFTINSLRPTIPVSHYEETDWQDFDPSDKTRWSAGLKRLEDTQKELLSLLQQSNDSILPDTVPGREYDFRHLLFGLVQHDIYHAGQVAYVSKLLKG